METIYIDIYLLSQRFLFSLCLGKESIALGQKFGLQDLAWSICFKAVQNSTSPWKLNLLLNEFLEDLCAVTVFILFYKNKICLVCVLTFNIFVIRFCPHSGMNKLRVINFPSMFYSCKSVKLLLNANHLYIMIIMCI